MAEKAGIFATFDDFLKERVFQLQEFVIMGSQAFRNVMLRPFYGSDVFLQMDAIGVGSLPIVVLTGFFTGAVMALQLSTTLAQYGQIDKTGQLVTISLVKELGPVLGALMVAGRNAAGMASELGSMVVTEQVDAMRALGTDPMKKLVTPRLIATVVMLFFLSVLADICGVAGGFVYSVLAINLDATQYWYSAFHILEFSDLVQGLIKPIVFGVIIALIGCYYGLRARGGTQGVGRATTQSVVAASLLIIISDFVVSQILRLVLPT
jgi:phospholipid/cholesterol/gamma-HCH transport system permease protein